MSLACEREPPLPVTFASLSAENLLGFRQLNAAIFPVRYNDKFYRDCLSAPSELVQLAYVDKKLVGAVCCRREESSEPAIQREEQDVASASPGVTQSDQRKSLHAQKVKLYIMTLGVLAPYRERGIGHRLIQHVLSTVVHSQSAADVSEIYLHVQVGNDEALSFYMKYGFQVKEKLVNYYRKIHPADCFYVCKPI